jgi:prophage regulatory protein
MLAFHDLADRGVRFSRMHVDRLERLGKFPKRVKIGANSVAWIESEIDAWVDEKIAARDIPKSDAAEARSP